MKYFILVFTFMILVFGDCYSQVSKQRIVNPNPDAKFTATVDNINWIGECSLCFNNEEETYLCFTPYDYYDHITIKIKFNGIGEYPLIDSAAALVRTNGGDVLNGIFYSFGDSYDKVNITYYDEENKFVEGNFQFKLKRGSKIIYSESKNFRAYFFYSK